MKSEHQDGEFINALADVCGKVAHDLSNPVALLKMQSDILPMKIKKSGSLEPEQAQKHIESLKRSTEKMEASINNLKKLIRAMRQEPQKTQELILSETRETIWNKLDF